MRHPIIGALACAAFLAMTSLGAPTRAADNLPIEAFYGKFQGSGLARADESDFFGLTVRDLDVTISAADGGVAISWTTVLRQGGDPENPDIRRKADLIVFEPTERPGIYRARRTGDPLRGEPMAWAYVREQTLTVHSLVVLEKGDYVIQTYNRTLSDLGMELEFISVRNGETARRVEGRLTKQSN